MTEERALLIIEVQAGLIPGQPIDSLTKRFVMTETEFAEAMATEARKNDDPNKQRDHPISAPDVLLSEVKGRAMAYQALLQHPAFVNWVRMEWIWL